MRCLLLLGGAAIGAGAWWLKKHHAPGTSAALTPARAAVHGHLMQNEHRPDKLLHMSRMFGAEGLPEQAKELASKAKTVRAQAAGAQALVERARAGDQNAMGMMAAIREQAQAGSPRARVSCVLMARYCELHPMPELGPHGEMAVAGVPPELSPQDAFHGAVQSGMISSPFGCAA